jgi:sulfate/thiosulfate transport system ATP-binding protein
MSIEVRNVTKKFGSFTAVDDVSVTVPAGELVALLGPSGSGKTSLLRIIAGLEAPDAGAVFFEGEDQARRDVRARRVGFVFQHYALFRHMTVFENVAFGLRVRPRAARPSAAAIRAKVMDLLRLVQLDWLADRRPSELSGGQRQRVALARALAVEPKVLLLDEPFGSLDARIRQELRRWLRRLHDDIRLTSVFVTHDQEEALDVADRVVVMNRGRIEQMGTPQEVFEHPATPFVMTFLGQSAMFAGTVQGGVPGADRGGLPRPPARGVASRRGLRAAARSGGDPRRERGWGPVGDAAPHEPRGSGGQDAAGRRRGPEPPGRGDARAERVAPGPRRRAPLRQATQAEDIRRGLGRRSLALPFNAEAAENAQRPQRMEATNKQQATEGAPGRP